jgi:hypothetical protein
MYLFSLIFRSVTENVWHGFLSKIVLSAGWILEINPPLHLHFLKIWLVWKNRVTSPAEKVSEPDLLTLDQFLIPAVPSGVRFSLQSTLPCSKLEIFSC